MEKGVSRKVLLMQYYTLLKTQEENTNSSNNLGLSEV